MALASLQIINIHIQDDGDTSDRSYSIAATYTPRSGMSAGTLAYRGLHSP